ncbi:MAG TPA: redoxin domain-containing protein [Cytophagaceae bacterium]|nr:redoxin domain-containing protein [Cytophagaceae bacterium]
MKNLNFKTYTFLIFSVLFIHNVSNAQYIKKRAKTLPELMYYTLDAKLFTNSNLVEDSGLILLYLDPSCEACHKELKQIIDNLDYLKDVEIVIISPNPRKELEVFAKQYELAKYSQITLLHDPRDVFYRQFKLAGYPSLYIYNNKKELISEFNSFVDFSEIMDGFLVASK